MQRAKNCHLNGVTQLQSALLIAAIGLVGIPTFNQLGGSFAQTTTGLVEAETLLVSKNLVNAPAAPTSQTPRLAYSSQAVSSAIVRPVSKVARALEKVKDASWRGLRAAHRDEFNSAWYRRTGLVPESERLRGLGNRAEAIHPDVRRQLGKIPDELLDEVHQWKRGDDPNARLVFVDIASTDEVSPELIRVSVADGINARQNYDFNFELTDSAKLPKWELAARVEEGAEGQRFEDAIRGFADMVALDDYKSMERALETIARSRKLTGTLRSSVGKYIEPLTDSIADIRRGVADMDAERIASARDELRGNLERFAKRGWIEEDDIIKLDLTNLLGDSQNAIDRRTQFLADLDRQEAFVALLKKSALGEADQIRDGVRAKELPENVRRVAELSLDGEKVAGSVAEQALLDVINANLVRSRLVFWNGGFETDFLRKQMRDRLIPNSQRKGGPKWVSPDAQLEWDGRRVTGGQRSVYRLYERLNEPSFSIRDAARMYLYDPQGVDIDGTLRKLGLGVSNKGPRKTAYTLARLMKGMAPYLPDDYGAILTEQLLYRSVRLNIRNKILPTFDNADELAALVRRDPELGKILEKDIQDVTIATLDFEATSKYVPSATQFALQLNKGGDVIEELDFLVLPVKHKDPLNPSMDPESYRVIRIDPGAQAKTVSERFPNGIGDDVVADSPTFLDYWESTLKPALEKADLFEAYNAQFEAGVFANELFDLMIAAERKSSKVVPEGQLTPAEQLLPKSLLRPSLDAFPLFQNSSVGLVDLETKTGKGYRYKRGYGTHKLESAAYLLNGSDDFSSGKAHDALFDVMETIAVRQVLYRSDIIGRTVREILEQQRGIRAPNKVLDLPALARGESLKKGGTLSVADAIRKAEREGGTARAAWTVED